MWIVDLRRWIQIIEELVDFLIYIIDIFFFFSSGWISGWYVGFWYSRINSQDPTSSNFIFLVWISLKGRSDSCKDIWFVGYLASLGDW